MHEKSGRKAHVQADGHANRQPEVLTPVHYSSCLDPGDTRRCTAKLHKKKPPPPPPPPPGASERVWLSSALSALPRGVNSFNFVSRRGAN